ncbi:DUF4365 domain-containing protein [Burkholderia contaminans]|uniref:DUF4365 domain-containing protein n=1 Tax=Burkholderia contaminans TaxID=488447 RepID=UPI0012600F04|nr:DUF4365 domain-containing protein [Burkholderia contaminans]
MNTYLFDQGNAGESLAAAYLSLIFNGEAVRETMRGEGMGALDLQLKFETLYPVPSHIQVAVQVKTGPSFAKWTPTKNRWRLQNLDKNHIAKWRATNQPVLLIWVRLDPELKLYWKLINPKTPIETLSVSESHVLTPASRPEIERLLIMRRDSGKGIHKLMTHTYSATSEIRGWAKARYERLKGVHHCCLGNVSISNYAWRHLTRVTRPQSHIRDSLTAIAYVRQILDATPHQIQTQLVSKISTAGKTLLRRKVLAIYRDVRFSDRGTCVVYVRLDEQITYSDNWLAKGLIRQKVHQELKLESIYRKTA